MIGFSDNDSGFFHLACAFRGHWYKMARNFHLSTGHNFVKLPPSSTLPFLEQYSQVCWGINLVIFFSLVQYRMSNNPVTVNLRIETGTTSLDMMVQTQGHDVQPETGPARPADGTNGNVYPAPVPTCTSALDDASRPLGQPRPFIWDG
jgi:hypothetical protein